MKVFAITQELYRELDNDCCGVCLKCGQIRSQCEPDAEHYTCDECESDSVFGAAQALILGRLYLASEFEFEQLPDDERVCY